MSDNERFNDNGNGTITDNKMNVMWKKTDSFQDNKKWINWFKGQDYVEITNLERFAGYEDWRFPTEEEAWSLFDLDKKNTDRYGDEIYLDPVFEPGSAGGRERPSSRHKHPKMHTNEAYAPLECAQQPPMIDRCEAQSFLPTDVPAELRQVRDAGADHLP